MGKERNGVESCKLPREKKDVPPSDADAKPPQEAMITNILSVLRYCPSSYKPCDDCLEECKEDIPYEDVKKRRLQSLLRI